jgi:hypothetical protein
VTIMGVTYDRHAPVLYTIHVSLAIVVDFAHRRMLQIVASLTDCSRPIIYDYGTGHQSVCPFKNF